jgi:integrase
VSGRPSKLTSEMETDLVLLLANGLSIRSAARVAGVSRRSLTRWLADGLRERVAKARETRPESTDAMLPRQHLLPYLMIDWTALRIGALEEAKIRDLDEHRQAFLARASVAKNERPVWLALHDVLYEAVLADLPPREDRDLDAPLFPAFKGANLRTSITRACKATGTPHFSPHGLRKRRGSLLSKQGYSLAEIAERLGDTKVVTAEHYLFALGDYAEVDYTAALDRAAWT